MVQLDAKFQLKENSKPVFCQTVASAMPDL